MNIEDISQMTINIVKANAGDASDIEVLKYLDSKFDIAKIPSLTDEDKAVDLIKKVIADNGYILGCSDYDSDGLGGGAVIHKALKGKSNNYDVICNKRCNGNGFNPVFIEQIKKIHDKKPISLIITADHGSACRDELKELKDYGIKHIIITDHHDIPIDRYPDTVDVFINPQKVDGDPIGMCGTYVVFKVLSNLYKDDKDIYTNLYKPCLPHVAIATISDVMSLNIWYNRVVVRAGLDIMNSDIPLWDKLSEALNIPISYSYKDIGYVLAPFINTGNRASREELYLEILTTEDETKLDLLIQEGCQINITRKSVRKKVLSNVMMSIDTSTIQNSLALIVEAPMAINGILANSIGDTYNVPVVCFSVNKKNNTLSGSARACVEHVHIAKMFNRMAELDSELFLGQGGHAGAGGCTIPFDKFDTFKKLFDIAASEFVKPDVVKDNEIIMDINTKYLTPSVIDWINYAGPYGKDWIMPKLRGSFRLMGMFHVGSLAILNVLGANGKKYKATYFYNKNETMDSINDRLTKGTVISVVFEPQYYRRRNKVSVSLLIHEITEKKI